MCLPATPRQRWGLQQGGDVAYLDLGEAIIVLPGRVDDLRSELIAQITDADWELARQGFGDSDLANE